MSMPGMGEGKGKGGFPGMDMFGDMFGGGKKGGKTGGKKGGKHLVMLMNLNDEQSLNLLVLPQITYPNEQYFQF